MKIFEDFLNLSLFVYLGLHRKPNSNYFSLHCKIFNDCECKQNYNSAMSRWKCASTSTKPPVWEDDKYIHDGRSLEDDDIYHDAQSNLEISEGFSIELMPVEILFMILEKLDENTLVNCLHVNRKWRSIALSIAAADRTNEIWKYIHDVCLIEETYKLKSVNMPYNEMFANSLRWNIPFSYTLSGTCVVNYVKKINIYKDNIIVIDCDGVKYYDVHTHHLKKSLQINQCYDFIERDTFILRCTQDRSAGVTDCKLFLYGKKHINDNSFEDPVQRIDVLRDNEMNFENSVMIGVVSQYAIEYNCCYIMNAHSNVLACYIWQNNQWDVSKLGRFYGNRDDKVYALSVLRSEVYLMIKWGQMMRFSYAKRNFTEVCRARLPPNRNVFVKMVHKFCLVIGVPGDCEFRITRMRNNKGYNFYKFECPNLTCVTQHTEMLLLGYSDGRVEIFMPRAQRRQDMFKRRIHISEFVPGPIDPENLVVISIDVFEELGQHYLFIATHAAVYQLLIKHDENYCIWDYIPERPEYFGQPLSRYMS